MSTPQLPPQIIPPHANQLGQRTVTTPMQSQHQMQVPNAGMAQQAPAPSPHNGVPSTLANGGMGMANGQQPQTAMAGFPLAPLGRPQFTHAYFEQWLPKHMPKDKSILQFEGREIDLHQLHCEVMRSGSYRMVRAPLTSFIR